MRLNLTAAVVAVGLCLFAGLAGAAVVEPLGEHRSFALRPCSNCKEISYPTEQACIDAGKAEARRVGETRTTGSAVFQCIIRHNVIATFKANPPPPLPPVDCVVSDWGPWSNPPWLACAGTQQTRALVRTRTIVTQPANGGLACPSLVETQTETRPCPGIALLSWTPPTRNIDGSTLNNLSGYRIHYGTSPTALTQSIQVPGPSVRAYTITGLSPGTYFFAVRAYTTNSESDQSNVVSKIVQ